MKTLTHIWTLILTGMFLCLSPVLVSASDPAPEQAHALARVTQIRQDPLGYAETLGYNREELVSSLPWLAEAIYDLAPPAASLFLTRRAEVRNRMEPAASEPEVTVNTDFAAEGEISGVVTFINFLAPEYAVAIVIDSQLRNELDPEFQGKRMILSPEFTLMGTSFNAGRTQVDGKMRNAYYIHICMASSLLRPGLQVVNLINQVRSNPQLIYNYLPVSRDFFTGGPQTPLFLNPALNAAAAVRLNKPVDVLAHARYFGFSGTQFADMSVIETFPHIMDTDRLALWMFSSLLVQESQVKPSGPVLFNPVWNAVGPALYHVRGQVHDWVKLTLVSGRMEPPNPGLSRVYGVVYADLDENGIYTPGEEISDLLITAYEMTTRTRAGYDVTNRAGQFALTLAANAEYRIQTTEETGRVGRLIFLTSDRYLELNVQKP